MHRYIRNKEINVCLCLEVVLKTFHQDNKKWQCHQQKRLENKKPFLTNKRNLENPEVMLQHTGNIVLTESVLAKIFNKHYVNIVERSCRKKPTNISQEYDDMSDTEAIHLIYKTFENH